MKNKFLKRFALGIVVFIAICFALINIMWGNELASIRSIKNIIKRDDSLDIGDVYEMRVKGDFYLDDFVNMGGVKNDKELINFITGKITKGMLNMKIEESEIACSSFTARTKAGESLFARNYDMDQTNSMIVYTEKNKGRHASVSTVDLKFLGIDPEDKELSFSDKMKLLAGTYAPLDGMNDAGVAVGVYMTYQGKETVPTDQNTDKPDITSTTLLRLILDYADNLDEAIQIAKTYDLHDSAKTSYHYMVADKTGRSAVLEWVAGTDIDDNDGSKRELVVTYSDEDAHIGEREAASDYQVLTNFIIQKDYYKEDKDKAGFDRYNLIYDNLESKNAVLDNEKEAMDILDLVARRKGDFTGSPGSMSVHSVVYNLNELTALWVGNEQFTDDKILNLKLEN